MRKNWLQGMMVLACSVALLAGCAKAPTPTPMTAPEPAKAGGEAAGAKTPTPEMIKVNVASGARDSLLYLPMMVAEQLGYFKEEGLEVTITEFKGGAQVAQAVTNAEADFGSTVTDAAAKSKAQGGNLRVVALYTKLPGAALLVDSKQASTIKSVKDLRGKKIGVTSLGSGSHQALLAILEKEGLATTDVEVVGVGFDLAKALESGQVVAGITYDPYITAVTEKGMGRVLQYDLRKENDVKQLYNSDYPFGALLTRDDLIQKNPDLVQRMVKAIVRADQWITSHSAEEIAKTIPDQFKSDPAIYIKAVENSRATLSPNGLVSDAGMQTVLGVLKKLKVVTESASVKVEDVLDMTFVKKANS